MDANIPKPFINPSIKDLMDYTYLNGSGWEEL
jgi:hypothetical protein